jgi:hypothetical protein
MVSLEFPQTHIITRHRVAINGFALDLAGGFIARLWFDCESPVGHFISLMASRRASLLHTPPSPQDTPVSTDGHWKRFQQQHSLLLYLMDILCLAFF